MFSASWISCWIGFGGNEPQTPLLFDRALSLLAAHPDVKLLRCSALYRTEPISPLPQPDYLNGVCQLTSQLPPLDLLLLLQAIELELGKLPKPADAPRPIDLDLLFYGSLCCESEKLGLPHPRLWQRRFVLQPLSDLVDSVDLMGSEADPRPYRVVLASLLPAVSMQRLEEVPFLDRQQLCPHWVEWELSQVIESR